MYKLSYLSIDITGSSHDSNIGGVVSRFPAGMRIDNDMINAYLERRSPRNGYLATARHEKDIYKFYSGLDNGVTNGGDIVFTIENTDVKSADYNNISHTPRPSHADYPEYVRSGSIPSGGGRHSGRMTAPLCIIGAVCAQYLKAFGIEINAKIESIGGVYDDGEGNISDIFFPVYSPDALETMKKAITDAKAAGDSVGGCIKCTVSGMPTGVGGALFDGLEGAISRAVFAVPAVKAIRFGTSPDDMRGSEYNDGYQIINGNVKTITNNCGGILGGMSDGDNIVLYASVKPTPSIEMPQRTVNLEAMSDSIISVGGRHDACIVPRAVVCVEAAVALAVCDALLFDKSENIMKYEYGLIGADIEKSASPLIHSCLGDYKYSLIPLTPDMLDSFFAERDFKGINVTAPYKQRAMTYCDEISPLASRVGSVNTVIKRDDGTLYGDNTDYAGITETLLHFPCRGKKVCILGGGAAAQTAFAAATDSGAAGVVMLSHTDIASGASGAKNADMIINATPLGAFSHAGQSPLDISDCRAEAVFDMAYEPLSSRLLLDAHACGKQTVNGLLMLVVQAYEAAVRFGVCRVMRDDIPQIYKKTRLALSNIVLIGMPGCGKTTIGKALADKLGKPFYDTDEIIKENTHRTPFQIITEDGEAQFRRIERLVIKEVSDCRGAVIATGGGSLTLSENINALKSRGIYVYIKRDISKLATAERPLSFDLQTLYSMRAPVYESTADITAEADTIDETLERIIEKL